MIEDSTDRERLFRIAACLVLVVVLVASFLPPSMVAPGRWNLGHLPAYFVLTVVTLFAWMPHKRTVLVIVGIAALLCVLGLLIELSQPLVGRTSSLIDLTYNMIGVFTGVAVYVVSVRLQREYAVKAKQEC